MCLISKVFGILNPGSSSTVELSETRIKHTNTKNI